MKDFNKYIYLLVGASGSGKSTVAEILHDKYGWQGVSSYTTRTPRYPGEQGHEFVDKATFDTVGKLVGYTVFDGHEYGATEEQVDNADLYIIDPAGVEYFAKTYAGKKTPIVFCLQVTDGDAIFHMSMRGDDYDAVLQRHMHDKEAFANLEKRLQFMGMEYMTCHSDEINTPEVIAQIIYENRRWREMQDENI